MSHSSALIILISCFALAFAICVPFLFLVRRRRKAKTGTVAVIGRRVIPKDELVTLLAFVAAMFFGFAYAYTEPGTWFGKRMTTNTGRVAFLVVPALIVLILRTAWLSFARSRSKTKFE